MNVVNVTLPLPEELVERANAAGLLAPEQISAWLETALERKNQLEQLRNNLARLREVSQPLSDDEVAELVNAEIQAYRAEKRAKRSS